MWASEAEGVWIGATVGNMVSAVVAALLLSPLSTITIPFPPHLAQTTLPSSPAKHHGNCSTSASNACSVSRAIWV